MRVATMCNTKDKRERRKIDIFLLFVYVISLLVDLYNGYVQQILYSDTIIPILYKGGMLLYCMFFIFQNPAVVKYAYVFIFCYLCCICHWVTNGYALTGMDLVDDLSRLLYPYVIWAYLATRKVDVDKKLLLHYMMYGALVAAVAIVGTALLGIGVSSYGEDYGYGTKGFFRAGNDISLVLVMGNAIVSYFMTTTPRLLYMIYSVIITGACMLVGTTAGIIGAFVSYVCLILQLFWVKRSYTRLYKFFCLIIVVAGIPLLVDWTQKIINTDAYTMQKFDADRLLTGGSRDFLKDAYLNVQKDFTVGDHVWGLGYQELGKRVGADLGLGVHRFVELNQYEMTGYYGLILGGIILLIPIVFLLKYLIDCVRRRETFSYWMTIVIGLFVAHGWVAGHAYNNIQAMTMLVGVLFLYNSRRVLN